jgi:cytochrome c oxidase assembly factor CtaG
VSFRQRLALLIAAGLLVVVLVVPPIGILARRFVFVESVQFGLLASVIPALVAAAAPLDLVARAGRPSRGLRLAVQLAAARARHRGVLPGAVTLAGFVAVAAFWRLPGSVDALAEHPALVLVEAGSLVAVGTALWLELIPSPPFAPRGPRPVRIAFAAGAMWSLWVLAYILGMSHERWFHAISQGRPAGLSTIADQQLAAGLIWFVAALAFIPAIFVTLFGWLRDSEDADDELHRMITAQRRRDRWTDDK